MRISCDPDIPGYAKYRRLQAVGMAVRVRLDGVEQRRCIAVDTTAGWVLHHAVDENGHLVVDRSTGEPRVQRSAGRVTVEFFVP